MIFQPDTINAFGVRKDGGADLLIVPCGPLDDSPETQTQLLDKIECYLGYVNSGGFRAQCPGADGGNTRIILRLDREPPPPFRSWPGKSSPGPRNITPPSVYKSNHDPAALSGLHLSERSLRHGKHL